MGTAFLQLKSGTGIEESLRTIILGSSQVFGRDMVMADICITSPFISRRHAVIFEDSGTWYIQDLRSKNGTFINDKRLDDKRVPLRSGEMITFSGQITYAFQTGAGAIGETQSFSFQTPAFGIQLVEDSKDVIIDGAKIEPKLSPQEWEFLHILMEEPGKLYTYKEICRKL
ncbi:MAG: FHA domain-containing protein, partial [Anaerolineaceae bacterium]|nr:FHA domain-containing protein [Anaerolineaceae bacterium]